MPEQKTDPNNPVPNLPIENLLGEAWRIGAFASVQRETHVPYLLRHKDQVLESLEHLQASPSHKRGGVQFHETDGLIAYLKKHANDEDQSLLLASICRDGSFGVQAIIDHHGEAIAGWMHHKAFLGPIKSSQFEAWFAMNSQYVTQQVFAEFVESREADFLSPTAGEMLELACNLEASKDLTFKSSIRLSDGQRRIECSEIIRSHIGATKNLDVPELFTLLIPVFLGFPLVEVSCRLRHRIVDGQLKFAYVIRDPQQLIERIARDVIARIEKETDLKIWLGMG